MPRRIICTVCCSEILPDEEVTLVEGPCGYKSVMHADCCLEITKLKGSDLTDEFIEENGLESNLQVVDVPEECVLDIAGEVAEAIKDSDEYEIEEAIAEELSDTYGYTAFSFAYEVDLEKKQIKVSNIDWDFAE